MSKVNGQSVADREEHVGGTHPYFFFTWNMDLWLVVCGACLWAGPTLFFFSRLRAGGILPALYPFGIFLVFTVTNIFNFWVPAFSTI